MKDEIVYNQRQDIAARGFRAAIRLLSLSLRENEPNALKWLSDELHIDEFRMQHYYSETGLPKHLVNSFLDKMKEHRIPYARYQLFPNKSVIRMYCTNQK